ncbi:hypothetical protein [Bradyrhizobium lupini]|uniref:hypothetical protein n=1 Tax=Rhizobium lupini TaxID=136996 RepID=UPI0034C67799
MVTRPFEMPSTHQWSFAAIREHDPVRADRLERASSADDVFEGVRASLAAAIAEEKWRLAVDHLTHEVPGVRAILQFPVNCDVFDAFFNSRCGYRANYWYDPACGLGAEARLISSMRELLRLLPTHLHARIVKVRFDQSSRVEVDIGRRSVGAEFLMHSLGSSLAKIFVCERPIRGTEGLMADLVQSLVDEAFRLVVPRWPKARAICPDPPSCWLDWKGAFIHGAEQFQPKHPTARAATLHRTGWT